MKLLLAALVLALAAGSARAVGEGDEDDAVPGLMPAGGLVLFYDSGGPMSFPSMTPKDVPADVVKIKEVKGRACQRGVSVPIAAEFNATSISAYAGNGTYAKAVAQIKQQHPEIVGIYDVRTDVEVFSILGGLYKSLCTKVSARAFARAGTSLPVAPAPKS